ncbi:MAG TPA: hypothetical protein ENJ00_12200 [Phycisphaerales bacterium]|nr:hypothetical protein [Phycisphaerales bacterium]
MTGETTMPDGRCDSMTADELGELFGAFNQVTAQLQETHERLTAEVVRLKSELRRANDELERSRRLAALGEMAAGIAHEVRNPLGSIGLYAEMLIADLEDRMDERELARKIHSAVHGLDAVVSDVLSFSRVLKVNPSELDAEAVFERAIKSCSDVLGGEKRVEVRITPEHPVLHADANLVHQALVNVIRNAADAMCETGDVRPKVLRLSCRAVAGDDPDPAGSVLVVSDTGPGVPPEVQQRMFNPFFTTRGVGTGLGLAIVHRIVDAHGGHIRVHNKAGGPGAIDGAVIELFFPTERNGCIAEGPAHNPAGLRSEK